MTCTKLTDEAYAERLSEMDDDELHAEGFELVRKRSHSGWSFTARMVALNAELAKRDLFTASAQAPEREPPANYDTSASCPHIHSPYYDKRI
jgi:hypothetical protein